MADEIKENVCTRINKKLEILPSTISDYTIFKVPRCLYEVNQKAYEPRIVSIGPYHHGKPHLKMMEVQKVRFLSMLLHRTNEPSNAEKYVAFMRGMVTKARNCYAESPSISDEDFLEMLVLDGCFIVELIHLLLEKKRRIIGNGIIIMEIYRDLILFENQLPFFLLLELFGLMKEFCAREVYIDRFLQVYSWKMPGLRVRDVSIENAHHLLALVQKNWLPSSEVIEEYSRERNDGKWLFIRSATELRVAGIQFKKGEGGGSLFDIKFRNGVLEIPAFRVSDNTESLYRNIILCEQYENKKQNYFNDYRKVMDCLINTGKDVEILCRCGIIDNWSGDDEVVAAMFNRLGDHVSFSKEDFFYAQLMIDINEHFNTPWNKWMANLRQNYFNTPWALISFFAAVFLLLLTFLQTTFTIFP